MNREEILKCAKICVCGDREQDYGSPENNFELIGELWASYLRKKCVTPDADCCILPTDVAAMMGLFKIARIATGHRKADNWVDLAGYAACGGEAVKSLPISVPPPKHFLVVCSDSKRPCFRKPPDPYRNMWPLCLVFRRPQIDTIFRARFL